MNNFFFKYNFLNLYTKFLFIIYEKNIYIIFKKNISKLFIYKYFNI